jgi:hypothetical protein
MLGFLLVLTSKDAYRKVNKVETPYNRSGTTILQSNTAPVHRFPFSTLRLPLHKAAIFYTGPTSPSRPRKT